MGRNLLLQQLFFFFELFDFLIRFKSNGSQGSNRGQGFQMSSEVNAFRLLNSDQESAL